ncbi:hypothetical protein DPV73_02200 [Leptospira mayottensis]|nr:hypothetical protein DPV73_02200 [Leptospira mayottensis]
MTLYYLAADSFLKIKLNSCLVILGIPVSIFEKPGSLQFFLREFYEEGRPVLSFFLPFLYYRISDFIPFLMVVFRTCPKTSMEISS